MALKRRNGQGLVSASQFRPDGGTQMIDPAARLAELSSLAQIHPGRAPGGSGETGVQRWDSNGYRQMLQDRQEMVALQDYLKGGDGINTGSNDPRVDASSTRTLSQATGTVADPAIWGAPSAVGNATLEGLNGLITAGGATGVLAKTARGKIDKARYGGNYSPTQ